MGVRVAFHRISLQQDAFGRPGNFACHVVVGQAMDMPARALLRRAESPHWWLGDASTLDVLGNWILPTRSLSDIEEAHPGQRSSVDSLSVLLELTSTGKSPTVALPVGGNEALACMLGVDHLAPSLLDRLSFSSFESPESPVRFNVFGTDGRIRSGEPGHATDIARELGFASAGTHEAVLIGEVLEAALRRGEDVGSAAMKDALTHAAWLVGASPDVRDLRAIPRRSHMSAQLQREVFLTIAPHLDRAMDSPRLMELIPSLDDESLIGLVEDDRLSDMPRALAVRSLAARPNVQARLPGIVRGKRRVLDAVFRLRPRDDELPAICESLAQHDILRLLGTVNAAGYDPQTRIRLTAALIRGLRAVDRASLLLRLLRQTSVVDEKAPLVALGWETLSEVVGNSAAPLRELRSNAALARELATIPAQHAHLWNDFLEACEPYDFGDVEALATRIASAAHALSADDSNLQPVALRLSTAAILPFCSSSGELEAALKTILPMLDASALDSAVSLLRGAADLGDPRAIRLSLGWVDGQVSRKEIRSHSERVRRRKVVRVEDGTLEELATAVLRRAGAGHRRSSPDSETSPWLDGLVTLLEEQGLGPTSRHGASSRRGNQPADGTRRRR